MSLFCNFMNNHKNYFHTFPHVFNSKCKSLFTVKRCFYGKTEVLGSKTYIRTLVLLSNKNRWLRPAAAS